MISKILFHIYALYLLVVASLYLYDDMAYKHAIFPILQAQAAALVMLYWHTTGT